MRAGFDIFFKNAKSFQKHEHTTPPPPTTNVNEQQQRTFINRLITMTAAVLKQSHRLALLLPL